MSRKRIKKIRNIVFKILEEDLYARENDNYLLMKVAIELEPELAGSTFIDFMLNTKLCMESTTRAKRDFFKKYPELQTEEIKEIRRREEQIYRQEYGIKRNM